MYIEMANMWTSCLFCMRPYIYVYIYSFVHYWPSRRNKWLTNSLLSSIFDTHTHTHIRVYIIYTYRQWDCTRTPKWAYIFERIIHSLCWNSGSSLLSFMYALVCGYVNVYSARGHIRDGDEVYRWMDIIIFI